VTTTSVQQKAICIYCNYTASEIAIGSGMDWDLFKTYVMSNSAMNTVIPNLLGHVGGEGPSNWGEKKQINAK
jgi:hypothetical protein